MKSVKDLGIVAPLVHLNGTGGDRLQEQLAGACHALRTAATALAEAAPNQRDYYPLVDTAWETAREQHQARQQGVDRMLKELEAIALDVADQVDARTRK